MIRIILAFIAVIGGFLVIRLSKRFPGAYRKIIIAVTFLYGLGFLYFTLLSRSPSSGNVVNVVPFYTFMRSLRYPLRLKGMTSKLISGRWREVFTTLVPMRTAVLNILLFIPLGYLIPEWIKKRRASIWTVGLISLGLSCTIEIIQLVTALGWCDVDDLICNVLGGLIGYAAYCIKKDKPKEERIK